MAKGKSGLGKVAEDASGYAGDLIEPIAMLVGGASKASVAWAAFRNVWVTKVLGPVGMLTGAAAGATAAMIKLGNHFAQVGMKGSANIETLTVSFSALLKGMESATKRMKELSQFAAKSPFALNEVAEGSRVLEALTKGAMSTTKGLMMVGDAAAVSGRSFADMANWIGRLYDGLQSGRPVGEVAMQLQAIGVISGSARSRMEALIESGKAGNEVWAIAEGELKKLAGTTDAMSGTLDQLNSTLSDTKSMFQAAFSDGYLEGEKASVESLSNAYEKLTPLARELGKEFGAVSNAWQEFKAGLMTKFAVPGLENMAEPIAKVAKGGLLTILTASAIKASSALLGMGKAANGSKAWASAFGMMGSSVGNAAKAAKAFALGDAVMAGQLMTTSKTAASSSVALMRVSGASGILGGALKATGSLVGFVGRQFVGLLASIAAQPIVLITAAVVGLYMAWSSYKERQAEAKREIKGINDAMREQNALLSQQLGAVKSLSELNAHYAGVMDKLAKAYVNLQVAQRAADAEPYNKQAQEKVEASQAVVDSLNRQAKATRSVRTEQLETDSSADQLGDKLARGKAEQDTAFQSALDTATPEGKARLLRERADRTAAMAKAADEDDQLRSDTQRTSAFKGADLGEAAARARALKEDIAAREAMQIPQFSGSALGSGMGGMNVTQIENPAYKANVDRLAELKAALAETEAQVKTLSEEQTRASRTEIEALNDTINLIDAYNAAKEAVGRAEQNQDAAGTVSAMARQESLGASLVQKGVAEEDLGNLSGLRSKLEQTRTFKTDQNKQARDTTAAQEAEAQRAAMEESDRLAGALLDAKEAEVAAMDEGLAKTLAMLDLEQERINLAAAREVNPASQEETDNASATVAAERALALAAEKKALDEAEIGTKETLLGLENDSLEKQLAILNLARERLALQKGLTDEGRAAAEKQIDAEEQVVKQQYAKRDAASKLDKKDMDLAMKYRGAELEQKKLGTERERIAADKGLTPEERKTAVAGVDLKQAEMERQQKLNVKRAMLETNTSASSAREGVLESRGRTGAARRERNRRRGDERSLAQMEAEAGAESIADPSKRKALVEAQMNAFDEAAKADIRASRNRQKKVQDAADAYAEYMKREEEKLKLYARLSADQKRQVADQSRFSLENADALESIGIMVDKATELTNAQKKEDEAASIDENMRRVELFKGYTEGGYSPAEAARMTADQVNQERSSRQQEQKQEMASFLLGRVNEMKGGAGMQAVASSTRSIGGGGGAYGPSTTADNTREIKSLVSQIRDIMSAEVPALQQPERVTPYAN